MTVFDQPALTEMYTSASDFVPALRSAYLYMRSVEERSAHVESWQDRASGTVFVEIAEIDAFISQALFSERDPIEVKLRSDESLSKLWSSLDCESLYIDITGLSHHVWAPLLRSALREISKVFVVYVDPDSRQPI